MRSEVSLILSTSVYEEYESLNKSSLDETEYNKVGVAVITVEGKSCWGWNVRTLHVIIPFI